MASSGRYSGLFAFGQWTIPLAPWFVGLFFIRFMHSQSTVRGYVILSLVRMGLATIILGQLMPSSIFPLHVRYVVIVLGSLSGALPYLADRLIAPRLSGVTATLVFPVACTAWEFVTLTNNPLCSFGSVAYCQHGNLPLMQLTSVTGLSGLTFLITWFASTVNWIWERSFVWSAVRRGAAVYAAVMGLVLLYEVKKGSGALLEI